jgi:5'-AMP-activated protein kinase catalytic alpha subunit
MACTESIDIWSLAVVLYPFVCRILPFGCEMSGRLVGAILEEKPKDPDELSEKLRDFTQQMVEKDSDDRMDIEGVKNHPWLQESVRSSSVAA